MSKLYDAYLIKPNIKPKKLVSGNVISKVEKSARYARRKLKTFGPIVVYKNKKFYKSF